jgi:S1-C subfamily serine protease
VIGINSAIRTGGTGSEGSIGIGFAVPVDTAKQVLPTLKEGEDVERAYLGVDTLTVTPELNLRVDRGAVVQVVEPLSPADEAGLIIGDVIVRLDGKEVREADDVSRIVTARKPGDEIDIELVRAGRREQAKVKLGRRSTVGG